MPKTRTRRGWSPDAQAFQEKIRRGLHDLKAADLGSPYWIYVIRDPTTGDPRDWATGDPIYVGQTENLERRAATHMRKGGQATGRDGSPLYRHLYAIMARGKVPVFEPLEAVATRLAALAAETRWALRLRREFPLYNDWPEHKGLPPGPLFGASGVPLARVWMLTIDEAAADGVVVAVRCPRCGMQVPLPLRDVRDRCTSKGTTLHDLRTAVACPGCGLSPCLSLMPGDADASASSVGE